MYSQKVLDIFYDPAHVGVIKGANGVGKVVDETCGEIVKIYISVENGIVIDAQFQTFGCPALISASSVGASLMIGKSLDACAKITSTKILEALGGELPDSKLYVCPVVEQTIKSAIANYYRKSN